MDSGPWTQRSVPTQTFHTIGAAIGSGYGVRTAPAEMDCPSMYGVYFVYPSSISTGGSIRHANRPKALETLLMISAWPTVWDDTKLPIGQNSVRASTAF